MFLLFGSIIHTSLYYGILVRGNYFSTKGASNFFTSVSRLQKSLKVEDAEYAVTGSSLVGRFPAREKMLNLGIDGSTSVKSLQALETGEFKIPKTIIIEANLIMGWQTIEGDPLFDYLKGVHFKAGQHCRLLAAESRPSDVVYSFLRKKQDSHGKLEAKLKKVEIENPKFIDSKLAETTEYKNIVELILRAKKNQTRIIIVWIPNGIGSQGRIERIQNYAKSIAASVGCEYIDMMFLDRDDTVTYTDGVHLTKESAEFVLDTLLKTIE